MTETLCTLCEWDEEKLDLPGHDFNPTETCCTVMLLQASDAKRGGGGQPSEYDSSLLGDKLLHRFQSHNFD